MTEILLRYVKIAIAFAIGWALLFVWTSCALKRVPGQEMAPAIAPGTNQVVLVKERTPDKLAPGDIVVFEYLTPGSQGVNIHAGRVMGLPGQRVKMVKGELLVNDQKSSAAGGAIGKPEESFDEFIIPRDCLFLTMDNKNIGSKYDSRAIGPVGVGAVLGKVRK
jgi:signal peptidase I